MFLVTKCSKLSAGAPTCSCGIRAQIWIPVKSCCRSAKACRAGQFMICRAKQSWSPRMNEPRDAPALWCLIRRACNLGSRFSACKANLFLPCKLAPQCMICPMLQWPRKRPFQPNPSRSCMHGKCLSIQKATMAVTHAVVASMLMLVLPLSYAAVHVGDAAGYQRLQAVPDNELL